MESRLVKAEVRLDNHDLQIKTLFKDTEKLDKEVRDMGKAVIKMTTIATLLTPVLTALVVIAMKGL
tara:strand:+ start:17 stop:214 length:198 start_codon:yes stop_codon:yes gene_type:complete